MNRYRPLSRMEINSNLSLEKINKSHLIPRNNLSSFARRTNYNNQKLYMSNNLENKFKPKLFSLLDINDKITNSRGTVLPMQYKRLNDEENKRLFGFSYKTDKRYDFSRIQQILGKRCIKTPKREIIRDEKKDDEDIQIHNLNRYNSVIGDKIKMKNNNSNNNNILEKNIKIKNGNNNENKNNKEENKNDNTNNINNVNNKNQKSSNNKLKIRTLIKENKKNDIGIGMGMGIRTRTSKDRWFPKGYTSYEQLVKQPKLFLKQYNKDNYINKNYSITLKQIRDKANKSDIFFVKSPSEKEVSFKYELIKHNHQNSDIFNIKNDEQNLLKSSETYLYKNIKGERYNITRESNSKWKPSANIPTFINYSSKEYNILNPSKKGISSTKEKIIKEIENRKDVNSKMINNINYMNPIYRQKGLAEFIDITRNGASNPGKDFMRTYYNNPRCFYKQDEACNTFNDCYLQYKNICKKPFVKDFTIQ